MALCTRVKIYTLLILMALAFLVEFWLFVPYAPKQRTPVQEGIQPQKECPLRNLLFVDDSVLDIWDRKSCLDNFLLYDTMCTVYYKQQEYGPPVPYSGYDEYSDIQYEPAFECRLPTANVSADISTSKTVPKIVYYVFYGLDTLTFMEYMSFLSVKKFVKPWSIYVISDRKPTGRWWNQIEAEIGVRFVYRPRPKWIGDTLISHNSHAENMVVLQTLLVNGGIALDLDMLMLRSLDPLLNYPVTVGLFGEVGIGNDIILSARNRKFIQAWHSAYSNYKPENPKFNLRQAPYNIYKRVQRKVHLETTRFYSLNRTESDRLFDNNTLDWRDNYSMHLWSNPTFPYPESVEDIKLMDNILGRVMRYIYFGNEQLVRTDTI